MSDKQTDAQAIADSVNPLDVHERVGAFNSIVKANFGTETAEDGTGNPFKQAQYDGAQRLAGYTKAADKVEVMQTAASLAKDNAIAEGNGWLEQDLNDFSSQVATTFTDPEVPTSEG